MAVIVVRVVVASSPRPGFALGFLRAGGDQSRSSRISGPRCNLLAGSPDEGSKINTRRELKKRRHRRRVVLAKTTKTKQ